VIFERIVVQPGVYLEGEVLEVPVEDGRIAASPLDEAAGVDESGKVRWGGGTLGSGGTRLLPPGGRGLSRRI